MQVLCKASNSASDIRCSICGQGFLIYWTRSSAEERTAAREWIQEGLRAHHEDSTAPNPHPSSGFNMPEWDGPVSESAAALIGNAPEWALA